MFVIFGIIFALVMCAGLFLDSAIIHTIRKCKQLHTPNNVLIIGCIMCDMITLTIALPMMVISTFNAEWVFGQFWCDFYGFLVTLTGVTNLCILVAITLERYLILTKTSIRMKVTMYTAGMTILSCFWYGLLWATFPLVGWGTYVVDQAGISCAPDWDHKNASHRSYNITLFVMVIAVPVTCIVFCYTKILLQIRENKVHPGNNPARNMHMDEVRVGLAALVAIVSHMLACLPYVAASLVTFVTKSRFVPTWASLTVMCLSVTTSVWNPILFFTNNRIFMAAFRNLFMCRRPG